MADLLRQNPDPSDDEIREALSGNLCRCTGYAKIFDAVRLRSRVSMSASRFLPERTSSLAGS